MKRTFAIFLLLLLSASVLWAWGTLQTFTSGWTHVDTNGNLGVYTNALLDESAVSEAAGAYHVKSFGSGYFGNFAWRWYGSADAESSTWSECRTGLAASANYWNNITSSGDSLWVRYRTDGDYLNTAEIVNVSGGTATYSTSITINSLSTNYYWQFSRSGTTATLTVWTGGYESSLVGTVDLTCVSTTFEYCHAYNVMTGGSGNVHWQLHDLDLSGAVGATYPAPWVREPDEPLKETSP